MKYKNMKLKEFLFGDFDKDGKRNIDDPRPFNKNISTRKKFNRMESHYSDPEINLSDQLMAIKNHNDERAPYLKRMIRAHPGSKGRIKSVPSTLKKLRERYLSPRELSEDERKKGIVGIMDIAGMAVYTKKREHATKIANRVKKRYKYDPRETDDYYKSPKGGVYYAHHIGIVHPKDPQMRIEFQAKSTMMDKLSSQMHEKYKKGMSQDDIGKFMKKARALFRKGF